MIHTHHKMQYVFKFYVQKCTGVQLGFLAPHGRCPKFKRFRPKSYETCPQL